MSITVAKTFRILTVAPLMALLMLVILFIREPSVFGNPVFFILSVVFLTVLPLLAYPLQPIFPHFRDKGRDGQRTLAMIFAVSGYVIGCAAVFLAGAPAKLKIIFLSYLLSGILVVLFNKLLHVKASGHACGMAGPFAILIAFGHLSGLLGIPFLAVVYWSSLQTKRHTLPQLLAGTALPFLGLAATSALLLAI